MRSFAGLKNVFVDQDALLTPQMLTSKLKDARLQRCTSAAGIFLAAWSAIRNLSRSTNRR
jgi:hypothetical protein